MRRICMVLFATSVIFALASAQEHKMFHVAEVRQYPSDASEPACFNGAKGSVCVVTRWRVAGHTTDTDYLLECSEATTNGKVTTACYPMTVGEDIEVQILPEMVAYPPLKEGRNTPDPYAWYMIKSAKERKR